MIVEFVGEAIEWRGPAPFVFVPVPPESSEDIKSVAARLTYGWGCIPVKVVIGGTTFTTSLFPRKGTYLVPIKVVVQRAEKVGVGDTIPLRLEFEMVN